ncbi:RtcB family protein [Mobilicoccus caccae]|uniref:3'-phosphate/5'-hydroxy nucleic acid ligase n=1 Tax=Mobilicoccus caccae TaxID=1859295 RepID=A0ABQ6IS01_9MICO|nr:RtcB family protein [Mobilicoccus caccae]GMA39468.1 RNA-splicing ligase RtcB [Mobilicoccus caccae]
MNTENSETTEAARAVRREGRPPTVFPVTLPGAEHTALWAEVDSIEPAAQEQLRNVAALPWTHRLAVMPDVHYGKGATVGSVIAMRGAVAPAAVGVDIGCGMAAVRTSLSAGELPDDLGSLRSAIEAEIPVGFESHDGSADLSADPGLRRRVDAHLGGFSTLRAPGIDERHGRAVAQCGTLGGGNHFIEVTLDEDQQVWLMLHSGSRNIGNELARRHIESARGLEHNLGLPDRDLAVFLADTPQMQDYLHDLHWAQEYALLNREAMLVLLENVVRRAFPQVTYSERVTCHHNYVAHETYDGVDVVVTRKGAIRAGRGDLGLIPGSMGTGSYVVRGLGNEASLCSASHGAGRRMSRNKARKTFTVADLEAQTRGIECRKDAGVLDEIPGAYKDLAAVIAAQTTGTEPLVEVVTKLDTVLCVKG